MKKIIHLIFPVRLEKSKLKSDGLKVVEIAFRVANTDIEGSVIQRDREVTVNANRTKV